MQEKIQGKCTSKLKRKLLKEAIQKTLTALSLGHLILYLIY